MSLSTSTLRAVSRSRAPTALPAPRTLLPFLYQTATIQQWKLATRTTRRNVSSNPPRNSEIPFESSEELPPAIDGPEARQGRKTTMTGTERAAFEALQRKFQPGTEHSRPEEAVPFTQDEQDLIADEWYEEDEDGDPNDTSLDSVFDAVLSNRPVGQHSANRKPKETLLTLAESILRQNEYEDKKQTKVEAKVKAAELKRMRREKLERVFNMLNAAETDKQLWSVLEREVFDAVRKLDLDNAAEEEKKRATVKPTENEAAASEAEKAPKRKGRKKKNKDAGVEAASSALPTTKLDMKDSKINPRILFLNYPLYLQHALHLLRTSFPSSPLPLSILPNVKSLGRSSYALGATTPLYNELLRTVWIQQADYIYIDELLTDMDNGAIEYDLETLSLLDGILKEADAAQKGKFGAVLKAVHNLENTAQSVKRLRERRDLIAQRLGTWTDKRAQEGRLVRKFGFDDYTREAKAQQSVKGPTDNILGQKDEGELSGLTITQHTAQGKHVGDTRNFRKLGANGAAFVRPRGSGDGGLEEGGKEDKVSVQ